MPYNKLTVDEEAILRNANTEIPFTGEYDDFYEEGTFICRQCNSPLYSSKAKFDAACGWPAFDASYPNAVNRVTDPDGTRTELLCANCGGHLGHVFEGEHFTETNSRHCVNSLAMKFIPAGTKLPVVRTKE